VTATDLVCSDAVSVTNIGTVVGVADDGTEVTDDDPETVFVIEVQDVVLEPGISVDKTAVRGVEEGEDGELVVRVPEGEGATIGYDYLVTNTGDEALTDLSLVDDRIGDLSEAFEAAVVEAYGAPALPVGGSVTVTADYVVTEADIDAGTVTNVAVAAGTGLDSGTRASDDDSETVAVVEVLGVVVSQPPDVEVKPSVLERALPRTGLEAGLLLLLALLLAAMGAAVLLLTPKRGRG
jgi:hypothetical protein